MSSPLPTKIPDTIIYTCPEEGCNQDMNEYEPVPGKFPKVVAFVCPFHGVKHTLQSKVQRKPFRLEKVSVPSA